MCEFRYSRYYSWQARNPNRLEFYRQFIRSGDVCFDIGANIGQKTDIFLRLGARVIALEPQRECAVFLQKKYRGRTDVTVIEKAVDHISGSREIQVCEANALSSMSPEWIAASKASGRCAEYTWEQKQSVETITLDQLIRQYGRPVFCKIDVEGYELNVLKGLTQTIPALSFELAPESIAMVKECIPYLRHLGTAEFNHSYDAIRMTQTRWLKADDMLRVVEQMTLPFGDIYCRFV
jgi:FkbM family methyltransferase